MKNDIKDVCKMFVLFDDCFIIFFVVQIVLDNVFLIGFRLIIFCFCFGEKMMDGLLLFDFNREEICRLIVYVVIDIFMDGEVDLLWFILGLQELIGLRGVLSICLLFIDCGNF